MSLFKKLPLPQTRPTIPAINTENPTSEDLQRIAQRARKPEGHKYGASFHFRTVVIQGQMLLLDGNNEILKKLDIEIHPHMSDKEKERVVIKVRTELRSFARDLFVNFDSGTIQIGGFLFD